jgi:hypothetical protein
LCSFVLQRLPDFIAIQLCSVEFVRDWGSRIVLSFFRAGTMFFVGHRSRRVVARGFRCNQHFSEFIFSRRNPGLYLFSL